MGITTVIFVIAYLTGCLMALTRHPIFGLVTYVAVFYLHPPSRWWGASLPDPGWALLAAAVTAFAVLTRKHKVPLGPLFSQGAVKGLIFFLLWLCVQALWALDATMHTEMIVLFFKYILLVALMYVCIDSEKHLRYFLWAHVLGCFYPRLDRLHVLQRRPLRRFRRPGHRRCQYRRLPDRHRNTDRRSAVPRGRQEWHASRSSVDADHRERTHHDHQSQRLPRGARRRAGFQFLRAQQIAQAGTHVSVLGARRCSSG